MGRQMRAEEKTIQKMLSYPIKLEHDDGAVLVRAPDFPELTTFGDDRAKALMRAVGALEESGRRAHKRSTGHTGALAR